MTDMIVTDMVTVGISQGLTEYAVEINQNRKSNTEDPCGQPCPPFSRALKFSSVPQAPSSGLSRGLILALQSPQSRGEH